MKTFAVGIPLLLLVVEPAFAQTPPTDELVDMVTRMARIGRASSPTFSPDGKRIAFISDLNGVPQVWMAPVDGGAPTQITKSEDPAGRVIWSPKGDWLVFSSAPGGGMNTQIYRVRPDGTGLLRLTDGGKETNNLGDWTHDGRRITMGSNRANPSAIDAYLVDPVSGERQLVSDNKGLQTLEDVSRDGATALVGRLRGRGDNDLYVLNLETHAEALVTPHDPPGSFSGQFAPDGRTIYLSSDKDRDRAALARIRIDRAGHISPAEVVAGRNDAELGSFAINEQGTTVALLWSVAGRNELAFVDVGSGTVTLARSSLVK